MASSTAITCVQWIPRGVAKPEPQEEVLGIKDLKELVLEMKDMDKEESSYDDDAADTATHISESDSEAANDSENIAALKDFPGRQFFTSMDADLLDVVDDPFLNLNDEDSEAENEQDAQRIRETDCLLLAASADQSLPTIEVYVFDPETLAFYVHHEIMVGAAPLCLEWLSCVQNDSAGNYCAVGSYGQNSIEIWYEKLLDYFPLRNLDVLDQLEPVVELGTKKKQAKKLSNSYMSHSAAVLALRKNPMRPNVLASGSADNSVKIWDLTHLLCAETYTHHTDKVQSLLWHSVEETILLSASYDRTISIIDARVAEQVLKGTLTTDAESCCWNRHSPSTCLVSCEDGSVTAFDIRKLTSKSSPLYKFTAHEKPCTAITDGNIPGMVVTCSLDSTAKVWEVSGEPRLIYEKDLKAGPLFSAHSNMDEATLFAFGGKVVVIWDVSDSNVVNQTFGLSLNENLN